jgi:hypothetical protein
MTLTHARSFSIGVPHQLNSSGQRASLALMFVHLEIPQQVFFPHGTQMGMTVSGSITAESNTGAGEASATLPSAATRAAKRATRMVYESGGMWSWKSPCCCSLANCAVFYQQQLVLYLAVLPHPCGLITKSSGKQ